MRRLSILVFAGALMASLLATSVPAQAHDSRWLVHSGGGRGVVYGNHQRITVCDTSVDGHQVWVGFNTYLAPQDTGPHYWTTARPPSQGCIPHGVYFLAISRFRVCISWEGCTAFKNHGSSTWRPTHSTPVWRTW